MPASTVSSSSTLTTVSSPAKRAVSFHLTDLTPSFDVLSELAQNRDLYSGGDWSALCAFPSALRAAVDRLRARVSGSSKPGISTVLSCCIANGVQTIADHPDVQLLIETKGELDMADNTANATMVEEISGWFTSFPLGVGNPSLGSVRRLNLTIPDEVRKQAHELAGNIGASFSSLCTLAVVVTLATQQAMIVSHGKDMARMVDTFFTRVKVRRVVAEALLEMLQGD
jgi:hypothetical protein